MKSNQFENTDKLYEKIKNIGFFERLFGWKTIVSLSMDSYSEFKSIDKDMTSLNDKYSKLDNDLKELRNDLKHAEESNKKLDKENDKLNIELKRINSELQTKESEYGKIHKSDEKNKEKITELQTEIKLLKDKKDQLIEENKEFEKKITGYEKLKEQKEKEYDDKVISLNSLRAQLEEDRVRVQKERETEIEQRLEKMKETWRDHETQVESKIKQISSKYNIEYLDKEKVPFKGKPDNTLKICDEYIIFDAKCPASDDLNNFSTYIKTQTESAKKYIKEQDVKKDIFLVIPSNTFSVINQFYYNLADYNVYIIGLDSLEPIILSLKKIEEYEFAEQLPPEARENICRIIGKFAHATKRRIQIDNYFAQEFIEIYAKCGTLPQDILDKTVEFEKSDKINPPQEKRAKLIPISDLSKETKKIKQKAEAEDINVDADLKKIEDIELYK